MKYYIYWDEDYDGSDRDELLEIVNSVEEKESFSYQKSIQKTVVRNE